MRVLRSGEMAKGQVTLQDAARPEEHPALGETVTPVL